MSVGSVVYGCSKQLLDKDCQLKLLHCTIKNSLAVAFPPSLSYSRAFLKSFITQVENAECDVADEIYETYTNLLMQSDEKCHFCYKTYIMPERNIVLKESLNILSHGTTGLCTWQASQYFAEWSMESVDVFARRRVLELGSGSGFLGSVICSICSPSSFTFSDCHSEVLELLVENVCRNLQFTGDTADEVGSVSARGSSIELVHSGRLINDGSQASCTVNVVKLDWESVSDSDLIAVAASIDSIIATDVVYDEVILPSLVRVLSCLLSCGAKAYIGSVVRNPATKHQFLLACSDAGLHHRILLPPAHQIFHYDRTVAAEIVKLTR